MYCHYKLYVLPKVLHEDPVYPERQLQVTLKSEPSEQLSSLALHGHLVHWSLVFL